MSSHPNPGSVSGRDFLKNLQDSSLFPAEEITRINDSLPAGSAFGDGATLAEAWVRTGKLTAYQAKIVLEHRLSDLHIGNYDVLDLLGAGGMGTVFKARHRVMKRIVALKVLSRKIAESDTFVQRFQREVETIAQLNHQNIVMAYDADEAEVGHFLVMEFVNGRDLASEVQKTGPLNIADAVNVILQAARGLEYAHARGIIHRDIKPANLLRDASGLVKVADLGLARLSSTADGAGEQASITQAGGIIGTPDYMPPEQALDATSTDHRADVYSLGCTLFFLLTGRVPFKGGSVMALLLKHREAPIPDLVANRSDVPVELDAIFRRMVAKRPADRYATMTEVVEALEAVKGKLPTQTSPPPSPQPAAGAASVLTETTVAADSWDQLTSKGVPPGEVAISPQTDSAPPARRRVAELVIVLVEPSRTQANIIRKYLQQLGIDKVHATGSGKQALDLARETHAHALLSAMHLSDMTGIQLVEALHSSPDYAGVGIILASSDSETDETGVLARSERTVMMPKPFDLKKLAHAVANATGLPVADMLAQISSASETLVVQRPQA
jgi:serine/threonine protein kinase